MLREAYQEAVTAVHAAQAKPEYHHRVPALHKVVEERLAALQKAEFAHQQSEYEASQQAKYEASQSQLRQGSAKRVSFKATRLSQDDTAPQRANIIEYGTSTSDDEDEMDEEAVSWSFYDDE
jgi:recombinational DNA repair ATPase RecF